ncbi:unnamed protein product [Callosobruchus maculatus]|uniref:Uncharacterized protein n=1 Tax=Callosobruchus maculatus TaxID=64391 RepID=A0A653C693_CALMS|nr:unnamed protein product [Callosobruchus maculatus]
MRSGTVRNGNEPDNDAGGRLTSFLEWNAIRLSQVEGEVQRSDDGDGRLKRLSTITVIAPLSVNWLRSSNIFTGQRI